MTPPAVHPSARAGPAARSIPAGWSVLATALLGGMVILWFFASWRETPGFWRNAGGYPWWQRELVELTFYPLLAGLGLAVVFLTKPLLAARRGSARARTAQALMILMCWCLWTMALGLAFSNNIENWLAGRPIHLHSVEH